MHSFRVWIFVALLAPSVVFAQRSEELQRGARVRVTTRQGKTTVGTLESLQSDTVAVSPQRGPDLVTTPLANVVNFEVSNGRAHRRGAVKGALIGVASGITGGGLLGAATFSHEGNCLFVCTRESSAGLGAFLLGVGGLTIGLIGGAVVGSERWVPVDMPSRRP